MASSVSNTHLDLDQFPVHCRTVAIHVTSSARKIALAQIVPIRVNWLRRRGTHRLVVYSRCPHACVVAAELIDARTRIPSKWQQMPNSEFQQCVRFGSTLAIQNVNVRGQGGIL